MPILATSQNDSLYSIMAFELKKLIFESPYQAKNFTDTSLAYLNEISKKNTTSNNIDRSVYLEKRAEQLKKDIGVDFTSGYQQNINLDPSSDLEENISYSGRVQLGVEWDLLNNGLLENRVRSQMISDRVNREKLQYNIAVNGEQYIYRFDQTLILFNQFKLELLNQRLIQIKKQYKIIQDLVLLRKSSKEELIKVEMELTETESLINLYESYAEYMQIEPSSFDISSQTIPLIDLDYTRIFELVGLQSDSLENSSEFKPYFSWYHQMSLKPYLRYNYYDILQGPNRGYFAGGINLSIPLNFSTQLNNEVEYEKWQYDNAQFIRDQSKLQEDVLNSAYDFRHHLKSFIEHYQKRKLISEKLRIEKARLKISDKYVDPITILKLDDDMLLEDLNLIEDLQNLYLKALKIHSKLNEVAINEIVKSVTPNDFIQFIEKKDRSIYVWSSTFDNYTSDFLNEYIIYNEINHVIVSVNKYEKTEEKWKLMKLLKETNDLYFMLGDNKLFYNQNIGVYLAEVLENYPLISPTGIHLDIEPHTMPEWDEHKVKMQEDYLNLVKQAKIFCDKNELKLQISVPKHYNELIMNQLFDVVDEVYFMCYENVDTDFLIRKLKPYVDAHQDKVVIALRTEDFENRLAMENKVSELKERLGIIKFAYHDLSRMISLDKSGLR